MNKSASEVIDKLFPLQAVSLDGLIIPHIVKVDEIRDNKKFFYSMEGKKLEEIGFKCYQFIVWTTGRNCHSIQDDSKEGLEKKRKKLIMDINRYYGELLNV